MVGNIPIGGGAPVVIQSMLNTKTTDVAGSLEQLRRLKEAGCQIARLAVPNMEAARSFAEICKESELPLVADIHFDYKLAVAAAEGGAAKIRINPGNIRSCWKNMAIPRRKPWWRAPLNIWSCWKSRGFMIPACL